MERSREGKRSSPSKRAIINSAAFLSLTLQAHLHAAPGDRRERQTSGEGDTRVTRVSVQHCLEPRAPVRRLHARERERLLLLRCITGGRGEGKERGRKARLPLLISVRQREREVETCMETFRRPSPSHASPMNEVRATSAATVRSLRCVEQRTRLAAVSGIPGDCPVS